MSSLSKTSVFSIDIQELRRPEITHTLQVRWYTSIKDIKDQIHKLTLVPPSKQELFYSCSSHSALRNQTTLHDLDIEKSGYVLGVSLPLSSSSYTQCVAPVKNFGTIGVECQSLINEVRLGFYRSQVPTKTDIFDGTGGVYFMKDSMGNHVAVFKVNDQ